MAERERSPSIAERVGSAMMVAMEKINTSLTKITPEGREISMNKRNSTTTNNEVSTSQYTVLNFPFKNTYKQFQRPANVYFLVILCLQTWKKVSITNGQPAIALPLLFVLFVSAVKDAIEDYRRHRADYAENHRRVLVLKPSTGEWEEHPWCDLHEGDVVKLKNREPVPADMVLLESADVNRLVFVMTAGLDGETNLKLRQVAPDIPKDIYNQLGHTIHCDVPNKLIETFNGLITFSPNDSTKSKGGSVALGPKNILLRGCQVRNTEWAIGCIVYAGHETKIQMNAADPTFKTSSYMALANHEMKIIFLLQCLCCAVAAVFSTLMMEPLGMHQYLRPVVGGPAIEFVLRFFNYIIIFTNFIPISLLVTIDMVKVGQALLIQADKDMYYEKLDKPAQVRASELNEELGTIDHVFSDKTGTLTANIMEFRKCSISGVSYGLGTTEVGKGVLKRKGLAIPPDVTMEHPTPNVNFVDPKLFEDLDDESSEQSTKIKNLFSALALNHGVMPEHNEGEPEDSVTYSASSPDEGALVSAAKYFGFKFWKREPKCLTCTMQGTVQKFEILHNIEFTSDRKRSSVILKLENGSIELHTKGADNVICSRLATGNTEEEQTKCAKMLATTTKHIQQFAADGLRTLCIARREIPIDIYNDWVVQYDEASKAIVNRDSRMAKLEDEIETNLELVGATAIEDNLQHGVPDTLFALRQAGVKVWMLTGDKVDTAVNIGFSCSLWQEDMLLLYVVAGEGNMSCDPSSGIPNKSAVVDTLGKVQEQAIATNMKGTQDMCLVIDTGALAGILHYNLMEDLLSVTDLCKSVICARVSPDQKGEVVAAVRARDAGLRTLAIGDGANDVPMIQRAHVGVGIYGEEGLQAVNASDYAIGQFRFLKKLMLVHGRWSARRIGTVISYMFYKNAVLVLPQFFYAFLCLASGQNFYVEYPLYQGYNMIYTSLPIIAFGILDQDFCTKLSMKIPQVYVEGNLRKGHFFNRRVFWTWMLEGFLQATVVTFICLYSLQGSSGGVSSADGQVSGIWYLGIVIGLCDVFIVNIRLALETKYWCSLAAFATVISLGSFIVLVELFSVQLWLAKLMSSLPAVGISKFLGDPTAWLTSFVAVIAGTIPSFAWSSYNTLYRGAISDNCKRELAKRKSVGEP